MSATRTTTFIGALCGVLGAATFVVAQALLPTVHHSAPQLRSHAAGGDATNVHCGQVIAASVTLNGDLHCGTGHALTSAAKGTIVLNLNGHTIYGPGSTFAATVGVQTVKGVAVVTIENGTIEGFDTGISVSGSKATKIKSLSISHNTIGIYDDHSTQTSITDNVVMFNTRDGVFCNNCVSAIYSANSLLDNGTAGYVSGQVVTPPIGNGLELTGTGFAVSGNHANANSVNGIQINFGATGKVTNNVANYNWAFGISSSGPTSVDGGGNTAKGNAYHDGSLPIQCAGVVCG